MKEIQSNDKICLKINDKYTFVGQELYLYWSAPGNVYLTIKNESLPFNFALPFNFVEKSFVIQNQKIDELELYNKDRQSSLFLIGYKSCKNEIYSVMEAHEEILGKYVSITFYENVMLGQFSLKRPDGDTIVTLEKQGLYNKDATSYQDLENRYEIICIKPGNKLAKIWKVD